MPRPKRHAFTPDRSPPDGQLTWWTAHRLRVDPAAVVAALAAAGVVDAKGQPLHVRHGAGPHMALRRAVARRRSLVVLGASYAWRELGLRNDGALLFALCDVTADVTAERYEESAIGVVAVTSAPGTPTDGAWSDSGPADPIAAQAIADLRAHYDGHRGVLGCDELRGIVARHLVDDVGGIIVRSGPVVYVPAAGLPAVERLKAALATLNVEMVAFTVGGPEAKQLSAGATSSLLDDVSALLADVEALRAKGSGQVEPFARRIEKLEAVRARARFFSALLDVSVGQVEAAAAEAETAMQLAIAEVAARATR